ncbi:MAG: LEA type 2 family protein [Bacteroidia bacterium]
MKKNNLSFLLLLLIFVTGCKDFKEIQVTGVKGFKVNKIDAQGINADLLLDIKNPNTMGFSIYRSEFDVMYNGINLGKARSSKRVHISANSQETYSFNLKSDFKDINLMDIMKLVNGGGGNGMVHVKGDLKAGKFYLKKKFPVDVKEKARLN